METIVNCLLRPYRSTYSIADLGNRKHQHYTRIDGCLLNEREQLLHYSYYKQHTPSEVCVIYCHCNSGSRIEGLQYLSVCMERGWNVCLFDFAGSGQSQGSYISLGHYQSRDLDCVVREMRGMGNNKFLLWGRSMGAATIIFFLSQAKFRQDIIGCVLDSPYGSLWSLVKQMAIQKSILPGFIIEHVLDFVRDKIKQDHCFDIKTLEPVKCVGQLDMPLLFITSPIDECVRSEDVVKLYQSAASKNKQLEYIDKAHNSSRDKQTVNLAVSFLSRSLAERHRKRKPMIVLKSHSNLTGNNLAALIVKAQKQKDNMRRMKSQINLDRSWKQNRSKLNNAHSHLKTELDQNVSVSIDCRNHAKRTNQPVDRTNQPVDGKKPVDGKRPVEKRSPADRKRSIKCSLAHIVQRKQFSLTICSSSIIKHPL